MRFAKENEEFLGIGMEKPIKLTGKEIIISDNEKIIAIYPYRDSEKYKNNIGNK
jgi:DNA/RNA-binding domain of Phe-tRNA-synthetase-like protein